MHEMWQNMSCVGRGVDGRLPKRNLPNPTSKQKTPPSQCNTINKMKRSQSNQTVESKRRTGVKTPKGVHEKLSMGSRCYILSNMDAAEVENCFYFKLIFDKSACHNPQKVNVETLVIGDVKINRIRDFMAYFSELVVPEFTCILSRKGKRLQDHHVIKTGDVIHMAAHFDLFSSKGFELFLYRLAIGATKKMIAEKEKRAKFSKNKQTTAKDEVKEEKATSGTVADDSQPEVEMVFTYTPPKQEKKVEKKKKEDKEDLADVLAEVKKENPFDDPWSDDELSNSSEKIIKVEDNVDDVIIEFDENHIGITNSKKLESIKIEAIKENEEQKKEIVTDLDQKLFLPTDTNYYFEYSFTNETKEFPDFVTRRTKWFGCFPKFAFGIAMPGDPWYYLPGFLFYFYFLISTIMTYIPIYSMTPGLIAVRLILGWFCYQPYGMTYVDFLFVITLRRFFELVITYHFVKWLYRNHLMMRPYMYRCSNIYYQRSCRIYKDGIIIPKDKLMDLRIEAERNFEITKSAKMFVFEECLRINYPVGILDSCGQFVECDTYSVTTPCLTRQFDLELLFQMTNPKNTSSTVSAEAMAERIANSTNLGAFVNSNRTTILHDDLRNNAARVASDIILSYRFNYQRLDLYDQLFRTEDRMRLIRYLPTQSH